MLLVEHVLGFGFLLLGMVALTSYNDEMDQWKFPLFYKPLKPMQERWGKIPGTLLHILIYVLTPVGFGLLFLMGIVF